MWPVILTVTLKLKDFPRSQVGIYIVKVRNSARWWHYCCRPL